MALAPPLCPGPRLLLLCRWLLARRPLLCCLALLGCLPLQLAVLLLLRLMRGEANTHTHTISVNLQAVCWLAGCARARLVNAHCTLADRVACNNSASNALPQAFSPPHPTHLHSLLLPQLLLGNHMSRARLHLTPAGSCCCSRSHGRCTGCICCCGAPAVKLPLLLCSCLLLCHLQCTRCR